MREPVGRWLGSCFPCRSGHGGSKTTLAARVFGLGAVAAAFLAVGAGPTSPEASKPDDQVISAGRWDVVAVEWDGNRVDPEWLARLHVAYEADGSWAVFLRRLPVAEGRSTIRQDVSPKTFEMETLGSEGIQPSRHLPARGRHPHALHRS